MSIMDQGFLPPQGGPPPGGEGFGGPPAEAFSPDPAAAAPQGPPQEEGGADHESMIRDLLDLARQVASEADDDEEAADFEKVTSIIANILAKQQKQRMGLLKGANDPAALARVLGG